MRAVPNLVLLCVVACSSTGGNGGDDDDAPDGHDQLIAPLDGMENQGTNLLGDLLDRMGKEAGYHANVVTAATTAGGRPVTLELAGNAALRAGGHRGTDPFLDGMILGGSEGARLRISVSRGGTDVAFYRLEVEGPSGWTNACDAEGDDAVPLAGKWQKSGFHEAAADRISFACRGSVAYKCLVWGYLPGSDPAQLGWRAHQACTRMARGDYCASGRPHTRDGTLIQIFDFAGVTSPPPARFDGVVDWPPNVGRLFFEAAWSDGAHPASCLSRRRWQSLPTGTLCDDGELRDPRLDTGVRFCEDIEWPAPGSEPTGAILFNASRYTDLSLHVWKRDPDQVSTIQGFYQLPDVIQPFPALGAYEHVRNDGIILRSLRADLDPADFEELRLYGRPGDRVVAGTSNPPPGFSDLAFEGYARKAQNGAGIEFNLYRNADSGDYLSTTAILSAPYELQWRIGYVLPPESR